MEGEYGWRQGEDEEGRGSLEIMEGALEEGGYSASTYDRCCFSSSRPSFNLWTNYLPSPPNSRS